MKKLYFLVLMLGLLVQPVFAKTIPVEALENFSTENPPSTYSVKVMKELLLDEELSFKEGDIIYGKIVDVKDPKRLKRDATFTFVPEKYRNSNGELIVINGNYPAKYTTKADTKALAKSAALSVGNHFLQGLSIGYNAIEGAVKNEKDNRFKSSVSQVYDHTPFSYVEKGQQLVIQKDQIFFLNFKAKNEEEIPNYEYTTLEN